MDKEYYQPKPKTYLNYSQKGMIATTGEHQEILSTRDRQDRPFDMSKHIKAKYRQEAKQNEVSSNSQLHSSKYASQYTHMSVHQDVEGQLGQYLKSEELLFDVEDLAYSSPISQSAVATSEAPNTGNSVNGQVKKSLDPREYEPISKKRSPRKKLGVGRYINQKAHQFISEHDNEDIGNQSIHTFEKGGEKAISKQYAFAKNMVINSQSNRFNRKQYKENKAFVKEIRAERIAHEKRMAGASPVQKKFYAKRRQVEMYMSRAKSAVTNRGAILLNNSSKALMSFILKNQSVIFGGVAVVFIILMISSLLAGSATNVMSSIVDPVGLNQAIEYVNKRDVDLAYRVATIEDEYADEDVDEFNIEVIGDINTNQMELAAYLNAVYTEYTLTTVRSELDTIFDYRYDITEEVTTETFEEEREIEVVDPVTGEVNIEWETYTYEIRTLNFIVNCKPFLDYVNENLVDDTREWFDTVNSIGGNLAFLGNPFKSDWRNNITTSYGERVNPVSMEKEMHSALDIAMEHGTPIYAVAEGSVKAVRNDSKYGNFIEITSTNGTIVKYAHCSSLIVSNGDIVTKGDLIAEVGSTGQSTGNHLHISVFKKGKYFNPLFALQIN